MDENMHLNEIARTSGKSLPEITIGVLAGMGPRSTSPFLELLLDQCQEQYGAKYDIDYPHILIYSLPTPFFIDRKTDEEALKDAIKRGMKKLKSTGVDLIGIPCNSAHSDFPYITDGIGVPVLNIIEETLLGVEPGEKISLFATELTNQSGLYQKGIMDKGCQYIFEDEWQNQINHVIQAIKNKDRMETILACWKDLIDSVVAKEVQTVIIACTELNVVVNQAASGIKYIDSSKALAKGLIQKYLQLIRARSN